MLSKYRITIEEIETGRTFMNPTECDGFVILGMVGEGPKKFETLRVRMQNVAAEDIANALFTEQRMLKAAIEAAKADKEERRQKSLWRRLFGRTSQ